MHQRPPHELLLQLEEDDARHLIEDLEKIDGLLPDETNTSTKQIINWLKGELGLRCVCDHDEEVCGKQRPLRESSGLLDRLRAHLERYYCMREDRHEGQHVACTRYYHEIAEWPNEKPGLVD